MATRRRWKRRRKIKRKKVTNKKSNIKFNSDKCLKKATRPYVPYSARPIRDVADYGNDISTKTSSLSLLFYNRIIAGDDGSLSLFLSKANPLGMNLLFCSPSRYSTSIPAHLFSSARHIIQTLNQIFSQVQPRLRVPLCQVDTQALDIHNGCSKWACHTLQEWKHQADYRIQ